MRFVKLKEKWMKMYTHFSLQSIWHVSKVIFLYKKDDNKWKT